MTNLIRFLASILFCCALFPNPARADFLFEPSIGYGMATLDARVKPIPGFPDGVDISGKGTEALVGARIGFRLPGNIWIAADPQYGFAGNFKPNTKDGGGTYSRTKVFGDLGIDISMLRLYAGYGFLNELKLGDSKYSGGLALKGGLSFEVMTGVALNVEYHQNTFKDWTDDEGTKRSVSEYYEPFKESQVVVGLSFPFGMTDR